MIVLLPNSLFDDGSIEARNFVVIEHSVLTGDESATHFEWSSIQRYYPEHIKAILQEFKAENHHYTFNNNSGVIIEFQWD